MKTPQSDPGPAAQVNKQKPFLLLILLPAASCILSSMVGIFLGQIGNLLYSFAGQISACLTVPGFIVLFLISFGLSFLFNKLLGRLLTRRKDNPIPENSI